jgi:ribonuclease BN (tRNA processing enzyme)
VSTPAYGGKIAAPEPKNLTRLFLTHLHFDHTEGLSEFMLAPWIYFREGPIQVYGPPVRRTWLAISRRPT